MAQESHPLRVTSDRVGDTPVVRISGDIDLRTSPQLREQLLNAARQQGGSLLLDLSDVPYMDSSGVGTLVFVKREVERNGGRVVLSGLQPRVRSVFEITNLDKFFNIFRTLDEATGT